MAALDQPLCGTTRLTMAQALIRFLASQYVERDGEEEMFFSGVFGIFGHGNVAGIGQALYQYRDVMPYHLARNEQAMVHIAAAYARMRDRLGTFACTSSIGPGATNMVTGAAPTIARLPGSFAATSSRLAAPTGVQQSRRRRAEGSGERRFLRCRATSTASPGRSRSSLRRSRRCASSPVSPRPAR